MITCVMSFLLIMTLSGFFSLQITSSFYFMQMIQMVNYSAIHGAV